MSVIETELLAHGDSYATYEHRCTECSEVWLDGSAHEAVCPFCNAGGDDDR